VTSEKKKKGKGDEKKVLEVEVPKKSPKAKLQPKAKLELFGLVLDRLRKVTEEKEEGHETEKFMATFKVPDTHNKVTLTREDPFTGLRVGETVTIVVLSDQTTLDDHGESPKK